MITQMADKASKQSTAIIINNAEWSATGELLISFFLGELLILSCQICFEAYFEESDNFCWKT